MTGQTLQPEATAAVAWVNGDAIVYAEYEQEMLLHRGTVAADFVQRHGLVEGGDFWHTSRGGETAWEALKRATLDAMVRISVQRALMRENAIPGPKDYAALLASWREENRRRSKALATGEVIYGPQQYSLVAARDYWFSNAVIALKRRLAENRLVISEQEVRERYAALKASGQPVGETFEDGRKIIQRRILDQRYESLIDSLVKEACVKINGSAAAVSAR